MTDQTGALRAAAIALLLLSLPAAARSEPSNAGGGAALTVDAARASVRASVAAPIPAFARLYGTSCSTCHIAAPKLNVLGEAFRLAGYRLPENDLLLRQDDPVQLGADPWKETWPRSVWPSDLPGISPLALRIQSDVRATRDRGEGRVDYEFPHEVYLLAGAPLGETVSMFFEAEWKPDDGLEIVQAKVGFRNVVSSLPEGALNLWVGRLNPFLLTFTDHQIDRAGVFEFSWQKFSPTDLTAVRGSEELSPERGVELGEGVEAVEATGLLGGRFNWALGLAQGGAEGQKDVNRLKDVYYRVRYKFGGLDLAGRYGPDGEPVLGTGGQLLDRALVLEHFAYRGNESTAESPVGPHRSNGFSARVLAGSADVGAGFVRRTFERPFATESGEVQADAWFAKAEYLFYPWLIGSLKYDRLDVTAQEIGLPAGYLLGAADRRTLAPGVIALIRQNVRLVLESRFYLDGDARRGASADPRDFFVRLDVAF